MADFIRASAEGSFEEINADFKRVIAILEGQAELALAAGDEIEATRIRGRIAETKRQSASLGEVKQATAELEKQAAVQQKLIAADKQRLAGLEAQAKRLAEQAALQGRLTAAGAVSGVRGPDTAAQAALGRSEALQIEARAQEAARIADEAAIQRRLETRAQEAEALSVREPGTRPTSEASSGMRGEAEAAASERQIERSRFVVENMDLERQIQEQIAAMEERAAAIEQKRNVEAAAYGAGLREQLDLGLSIGQAQERALALDKQRTGQLAAQEAAQARVNALLRQAALQGVAPALGPSGAVAAQLDAYSRGSRVGEGGRAIPLTPRTPTASPAEFNAQSAVRYNEALGNLSALQRDTAFSSGALSTQLTRLGLAEAEASDQLRRHGALTTEFLSALARGETTVAEFGYQVSATIGKFAGWTGAAALTFGALGALSKFAHGAIDGASGVQQLTRTIEGLDTGKATAAIQGVSEATNVPIKEAADAIFQFSRTFHNVEDASTAARLALAAFKLDGVAVADSVRAATAINQQFATGAQGLVGVFDQLAQGQQKFNARFTDMIPLLQRSSGAAKNAGGDLSQLIEIGTIALRTTQLSGTQVGTALQRAAANYLNPITSKGQQNLAELRKLGVDTTSGSYTQIFLNAIRASGQFSGQQKVPIPGAGFSLDPRRAELAQIFFGTGYGGRLAAVFGGGGAAIQPDVAREQTRSGGVLQTELGRQLATASERAHSFGNELGRLGAAFGRTGVVGAFTTAIHATVDVLGEGRHALGAFDALPGSMREVATAAIALRVAMLTVSRTRLGSTIPGLSRIPGFRPSEETGLRRDLAIGNRSAIQSVERDLAQSSSQALQIAQRQLVLRQQIEGVQVAENSSAEEQAQTLSQKAQLEAQLRDLDAKLIAIERERTAQSEVLVGLKRQQVTLTASKFSRSRGSDEQVRQLAKGAGLETAAEQEAAAAAGATEGRVGASQVAGARYAQAKERLSIALKGDAAVTLRVQAALGEEAAAAELAALAENRAAVAAVASTSATEALAVSTAGFRGAAAGFASRLGTFASALDPLTVALVGLPVAFGAMSDIARQQAQAVDLGQKAADLAITNLGDLETKARKLQQASQHAASVANPQGLLQKAGNVIGEIFGSDNRTKALGTQVESAAQAGAFQSLSDSFKRVTARFGQDVTDLAKTNQGRQQIYAESQRLRAQAETLIEQKLINLDPSDISAAYKAFSGQIQQIYEAAIGARAAGPAGQFTELAQANSLTVPQIQKQLQAYDDFAKVFGTQNGALKAAAAGYADLVSQTSGASDSQTLQSVYTAQQNLVSAITKNVQDWLHAATAATSSSAQQGDLGRAAAVMEQANALAKAEFDRIFAKDAGNATALARDHAAYEQLVAQFADLFQSVVTQQLDLMKSQSELAASAVQGFSPEADLQRAQVQLQGLQGELAKAQGLGADAKTVNGLQAQVNNAQNALAKQQEQNARSIVEAQAALGVASITGISPQADIQRAQAEVAKAQAVLGFDRASGAGEAQLLQDQATLDDSLRTLNQQIKQRNAQIRKDLASFIDAQAKLAESQTTDPVKQAREQVAADIKVLGTIKPQDYQTYQQYQTAILQQQATINGDRRKVIDAQLAQSESDIKFNLDLGRISYQTAIGQYEALLKTKDLSLQARQQILTAINQLNKQNQSAFADLNLNTIKLPTPYEIRRATLAAQQGIAVTNHYSVQIQAPNVRAAQQVGVEMDRYAQGTGKSIARAMGRA